MREQSLVRARLVCRQYQHLVGRILLQEPTDIFKIECVAVAPHDELNKWIFAHNYMEGDGINDALGFYHGPYYDVMLIARSNADTSTLIYTDLEAFIHFDSQQATLNRLS